MNGLRPARMFALSLISVCLLGCETLSGIAQIFDADARAQQRNENQLSAIESAKQARLLAGKSSRPSLASLNLMPQGRTFEHTNAMSDDNNQDDDKALLEHQIPGNTADIPTLSLAQKKAEYDALLPLITDPIQRRQAAFRLADINMLLAEQALEQGLNLPQLAMQPPGEANTTANGAKLAQVPIDQALLAQAPFAEAIRSYSALLNQHEVRVPTTQSPLTDEQQALNRKQMDAMYQLSRALDLAGQKQQSVDVAKDFLATFTPLTFGTSEQHIELYFRIGEYYFNGREYANASTYYGQVLSSFTEAQLQNSANFYGISAYMLGWSEFKQDNFDDALHAFDLMLKHTLAESGQLEVLAIDTIDSLSKGEMRLVRDSIRVMALTFSYQGSAAAIAEFYAQRSASPYQHLVYEELAQQYLDEDRFGDSADTLLVFAQNHPIHPRAVEFYVRHIDAYILGGFADRVILAKQGFVKAYSLGGQVLKQLDSPIGEAAVPYLKLYLTELAQTEHSIAQRIDGILQARAIQVQDNTLHARTTSLFGDMQGFASAQLSDQQSNTLRSASTEDLSRLRLAAYEQAIAYYENYISTFTYAGGRYDEEVPQRRFYLAEAYIALGRYQQAINAFEAYAYEDSPNPMAVEAAYAAILAYEQIPIESLAVNSTEAAFGTIAEANTQSISTLAETQLSHAQHSQQRFILSFASDRRAPLIAVKLMQTLFNSSDYADAQRWATWLLIDAPSMHQLNQAQQRSATLVMAHSEFAQGQFAEAEAYYRKLLARPEYASTSNSERQLAAASLNDASGRDDLIDRLAASLYKQAEQALASIALTPSELALQSDVYDMPLSETQRAIITRAIELWQTIITDTPSASFRLAAQYDSASYYALLGQWQQAIATWVDFAERYPDHALSASIEGQLLFAYEQTQDWEAAAQVLLAQWQQSQQTDGGREALYQAATFFERANRLDLALDSFRKYAHAYPEPLDMANEARFTLSEFYAVSGEDSKRRFWLNALIDSQLGLANNGAVSPANAGTPRSRYLAAMSAMVFATDADIAFTRIKLTLPLNKSLAKKQSALSEAINAYDRVMSFAVAQYATQANYHLANLYMTLAQDLMASSRPPELSALELSQYEMLLEEQAYPFEETAIELHENNAARAFNGLYDDFVKQSFRVLEGTLPARYSKQEITLGVSVNEL